MARRPLPLSPRPTLLTWTAVAALAVQGGCAATTGRARTARRPDLSVSVRFVAAAVLDRDMRVDDTRVGGLSALSYDAERGELLALTDVTRDSRFYVFDVGVTGDSVTFSPRAVVHLRGPDGGPLESDLDPEGIARTQSGTLLIASEGGDDARRAVPPGIYEFTRDGRLIGELPVPERFRRVAAPTAARGVRFNRAFESLSIAPSGDRLFTANEAALLEDTDASAIDEGMRCRILEYERRAAGFEPGREWSYHTDPPAVPASFGPSASENGLVDILALSDTELLVLERSFAIEVDVERPQRYQRIRLYRVSTEGAFSVMAHRSLLDADAPAPLDKTLVLDFASDTPRPPALIVDNYEGLAFGPALPDGTRTILLVSDDNFSERQRTVLLVFGIDG